MHAVRHTLSTLAGLLLSALACAADLGPQTVEQGGVAVSLRFDALGDGAAQAAISLTDAASGRAIDGARPAAWMLARRSEAVASERSCDDKAAALVSGSLGARADVDLNGYRLVTLNQDDTLAFINPHVGLQNSKLESIVQLPGTGHDWVLATRTQRLFVTLRERGEVAVVDVGTRRLLATVSTGAGSLPTRLALDEGAQRIWVGLDGTDQVLALDASTGRELGHVTVGLGLHTLTLEPGLPWLAVTNSASDTVSFVDRNRLVATAQVRVGQTPVAAAWSAAAQRLAVLAINGGDLSLVDPMSATVSATIALERGAVALGLFDEGRRALVINSRTDEASLLDLATPGVVARLAVPGRPDQIAFSREFAYLRSQATPNVQVLNLAQARGGRLQAVAVPMGRSSPADAPAAMNVASLFAPAPEGNGMLVANPGDGSIYRYAEGMMVPVGSFSNYRRQARALRVLDTSLAERAPGRFEVQARIEHGGRYDVVVRNLRPSVTACFVVEARGGAAVPVVAAPPLPKLEGVHAGEGRSAVVTFRMADADGHPVDLPAVRVLAMQVRGTAQSRAAAVSLGGGRYEARLSALGAAEYELMVQAPSVELGYERGRLGRMPWPPVSSAPVADVSAVVPEPTP